MPYGVAAVTVNDAGGRNRWRRGRSRHELWQHAGGLREHWYVAALSHSLRQRPLGTTVLGLGLVLYRRRDGRVVAMLDQCLHRGTALSGGAVQNDCLVCPYHGWRYGAEGQVLEIPSSADGGTSETYRQRVFSALERDGLIWVYMGEEQPSKPPFEMPFRNDSAWDSYFMVTDFDGDVSALAQNFMDVPHTVFVHDKVFRSRVSRMVETTVLMTPASVEVTYHSADDTIGLLPWLTNPRRLPLTHTDKFFAPNVTRCDYHWGVEAGFVITSQMTPTDRFRNRVYTLISYRFAHQRWFQKVLKPFIRAYTRYVINQDVSIIRTNRRGLENAAAFRGHSVEADIVHTGIDRLIDAYRTGEPLKPHQQGERRMRFRA